MTYRPGSLIRLTAAFTDLTTQLPADPGAVTVEVRDPMGTVISPLTVLKDTVGNYYAALTAAAAGVYRYKWTGTAPVVAVQEGSVLVTDLIIAPRPQFDLTDVPAVRRFTELQSDADDDLIQIGISGFSMFVLRVCGLGPADGTAPTASPLVQPTPFNEWYDGRNSNRLFLRNTPIVSVQQLTISGRNITESKTFGQTGWVIDDSRKNIALRAGGGGSSIDTANFYLGAGGMVFLKDNANPQNINVQYTAGYQGVPFDLGEMAIRVIGQNYKRRQWIDLASKSLSAQGGTGTTSYRDWALAPLEARTLMNYRRITY